MTRSPSPHGRSGAMHGRMHSPPGARHRGRSRSPGPRNRSPGRPVRGNLPPNYEPPEPSKVLGCFGLSTYTRQSDLERLFERYGSLEKVTLIIDKRTGESRGFGFIYFENISDAAEAKERLNGMDVDGRRIRVDFSMTSRAHDATPGQYMGKRRMSPPPFRRDGRDGSGGGGSGGGGGGGGGGWGDRHPGDRADYRRDEFARGDRDRGRDDRRGHMEDRDEGGWGQPDRRRGGGGGSGGGGFDRGEEAYRRPSRRSYSRSPPPFRR